MAACDISADLGLRRRQSSGNTNGQTPCCEMDPQKYLCCVDTQRFVHSAWIWSYGNRSVAVHGISKRILSLGL